MSQLTGDKPFVSIGLPVFNEERHLRQTLESIVGQDYQNFELIISDNASTDLTPDICNEFRKRDSRIKYQRHKTNVGAIANFNSAFELAGGKYFMWAGAHDLLDASYVSRAVSVLESNPEVILSYPRAMWIDAESNHLGVISDDLDTQRLSSPLQRYLKIIWNLKSCHIIHGLIRADALRQSVLLKHVLGPDIVLLADLSLKGVFAQVPEILFYRRQLRPAQKSDPESWKKRVLTTLEGEQPSRRSERSVEQLFREMRNEELRIILHSRMSWRDRLKAAVQTIKCCRRRFGVRLPGEFLLRGFVAMRSPRMFLSKVRSRIPTPIDEIAAHNRNSWKNRVKEQLRNDPR
jgi:glycosyltransferase involved in cell wall biosynthesis